MVASGSDVIEVLSSHLCKVCPKGCLGLCGRSADDLIECVQEIDWDQVVFKWQNADCV
jgi:hypothetical protein